jgi:pimeloyl-ACP methyl ester carboxylesterase
MVRQGSTRALRAAVLAIALCALAAPAASADPKPPGSTWTQSYIDEADGTQLHADVLRPEGLPDTAKTPVILSIGPYFNHTGQTGVSGPVEDTPYDPVTADGPSARFYDYINGAKVFERGYTWVQVDLRGFGGSSGCLDWGGPGEQADVTAAVEWAAKQPWSTGKVGMYGKSYDGVTGLVGLVNHPTGLAAVVSQEPVYDLYRYLYMNRVRFVNSLLTPALYDGIAGTPGSATGDTLAYNVNSLNDTAKPGCPAVNHSDQQDPNHNSDYWKARDLIAKAKGKTTPLFMTQGFLENNTKPDGAWDFFNNVAGPKRAWFGMWDHVRGNDKDSKGRLLMGRQGWFDETMRFYDQYLKGTAPTVKDPTLAVESSDGKWRAEEKWPPPDSLSQTTNLKPGGYSDDSTNTGEDADTSVGGVGPFGEGAWTFSPPFQYTVHLAGVPHITADLDFPAQDANFVADVYDIDKNGIATLISRGAYLAPSAGKIGFDLYGNDWTMPAGHRLGVLLNGANSEWWAHVPTGQQVTVKSASITLPFLGCRRSSFIQGDPSVKLESYTKNAPFTVDAATVADNTSASFALPADQGDCTKQEIAGGGPSGHGCIDRRTFKFNLHHRRGDRVISVRAWVNGRLVAKKHGHNLRTLTLKKLPLGKFKVTILTKTRLGHSTRSVRTYKGCRKSRPHVTHPT